MEVRGVAGRLWVSFVFSSWFGNPDGMLCYQNLFEPTKTYGFTIEKPLIVRINAAEDLRRLLREEEDRVRGKLQEEAAVRTGGALLI